jgi:CheY-like chemotaxis protein
MLMITVCDDDRESCRETEKNLRRYMDEKIAGQAQEVQIRVFNDPDDLLRHYPRGTQLLLLDIQMPGIDGYEAARSIRRLYDKEHAEIPIIAMTANAFDEDMEKARSAGMDGYIAKPVDPESLKTILGMILPV